MTSTLQDQYYFLLKNRNNKCKELRHFLDQHSDDIDINNCLRKGRSIHPLHVQCRHVRYFNFKICRLLFEYGVDIQAFYPHIIMNGIQGFEYGKGENFWRLLQLIEDIGDYCLYVDPAFVEGTNPLPLGYDLDANEDNLLLRSKRPPTFRKIIPLFNRYGSLYNVYVRCAPAYLIEACLDTICLAIECDLISSQWRYYIAEAAVKGTTNHAKIWTRLGVLSKGFVHSEHVLQLVDVSLLLLAAQYGNVTGAKQIIPLFGQIVPPTFLQLVLDCALYHAYNSSPMITYLVSHYHANPNRKFSECSRGYIEFDERLLHAYERPHSLIDKLQSIFKQYYRNRNEEDDPSQALDLDRLMLECSEGHTISRSGWAVLHLECYLGRGPSIDRIIYLIEQGGADPWLEMGAEGSNYGFNLFHMACYNSRQNVVSYFVDKVMNKDINRLWFDDYDDNRVESAYRYQIFQNLVGDSGTQHTIGSSTATPHSTKITALMLACKKSLYHSATITNLIVNFHADVNAVDSNGETLLIRLLKAGYAPPLAFVMKQTTTKISMRCRSNEGKSVEDLLVESDPLMLKAIEQFLPKTLLSSVKKKIERQNKKRKHEGDEA